MVDLLLGFVKEKAAEMLSGQDLNDEQVETSAGLAGNSIMDFFKEQVMSGNISGLQSLLSGNIGELLTGDALKGILGNFSSSLQEKVGLGEEQATGIAEGTMPELVKSVADRFTSSADEDAGFDLSKLSELAGEGGIGDVVKNVLGDQLSKGLGGLFGK